MPKEFKFPDIGEGIEEGRIVKWQIKEGDSVEEHQVVGEIETDKAVAEIPSPYSGKITKINFKEGDTVKVGEVLFVVEGGEGDAKNTQEIVRKSDPEKIVKPAGAVGYLEEAAEVESPRHGLAVPAVRKLAKELGVDLARVKGTGFGGKITEGDVRIAKKPQVVVKKKYDMWGYIDHAPLVGIRRAIAKHMVEAVKHAPHVTIMDEMDASALVKIREEKLKEALRQAQGEAEKQGVYLTYLPFIMKALAAAMKEYPRVNAEVDEEAQDIIIKKYYNFGVAVDVDGEGLVVPVLKGVDMKDIFSIAKEIKELADRTRAKKLDLQDMKGGTFTITNFGSLGSWFATPILNYPEVAILGLGRMKDKPVVINGKIEVRPIMPLSLAFDHRVIDGAYAIRFLNALMQYLQEPEKLEIKI